VLIAAPGVEGTWSGAAPLLGQSALYLATGMITGVAFGMVLLASTPAIVALFALPIAWSAAATLSFFADVAPWLDTRLALDRLPAEVFNASQWAHAGTALALWMLLPLLIGIARITKREVAS
jgi:ABC-2 type transport system permease protein